MPTDRLIKYQRKIDRELIRLGQEGADIYERHRRLSKIYLQFIARDEKKKIRDRGSVEIIFRLVQRLSSETRRPIG